MTADRQCCGRELRRAPIQRRRIENLRPAPERERSGWPSLRTNCLQKRPNPSKVGPAFAVSWVMCDASIGAVVDPPDQVGNTTF